MQSYVDELIANGSAPTTAELAERAINELLTTGDTANPQDIRGVWPAIRKIPHLGDAILMIKPDLFD